MSVAAHPSSVMALHALGVGVVPEPAYPPVVTRRVSPKRSRSRRNFYAIAATKDEIVLPSFQPLGYLTQSKLIERAQDGDHIAMQTVWLANARLAYTVANIVRGRPDIMADLVQQAQTALPRAIQHFEIERLLEFSTYAFPALRREVTRWVCGVSFSIPVPPGLHARFHEFRRRVPLAVSRTAWFDARNEYLDTDPALYTRLLRIHKLAEPEPVQAAAGAKAPTPSPSARLQRSELFAALEASLGDLSERDRLVLVLRYGLRGHGQATLEQIGIQIGVTKERVRQIQLAAEAKLAQALKARGWDYPPEDHEPSMGVSCASNPNPDPPQPD